MLNHLPVAPSSSWVSPEPWGHNAVPRALFARVTKTRAEQPRPGPGASGAERPAEGSKELLREPSSAGERPAFPHTGDRRAGRAGAARPRPAGPSPHGEGPTPRPRAGWALPALLPALLPSVAAAHLSGRGGRAAAQLCSRCPSHGAAPRAIPAEAALGHAGRLDLKGREGELQAEHGASSREVTPQTAPQAAEGDGVSQQSCLAVLAQGMAAKPPLRSRPF